MVEPSAEGLADALVAITHANAVSRGAAARTSYEQNHTTIADFRLCSRSSRGHLRLCCSGQPSLGHRPRPI